jgi:hypothetical protein
VLSELATEPGPDAGLTEYLTPHVNQTPYRRRLAESRSIGSRMVEGACKTAIGWRLKQTGERSKVQRLERMASLCCLVYADPFDAWWLQTASYRPDSVTAPYRSSRTPVA